VCADVGQRVDDVIDGAGDSPDSEGKLDGAGLVDTTQPMVHGMNVCEYVDAWDIASPNVRPEAVELFHAAPGGQRSTEAFSQSTRWDSLDLDRESGCIRSVKHAYTKDGGLAVLKGNLAPDGAVVKTAGVDEELWTFSGPAKVFESQEEAVDGILNKAVQPGDVVV